ncbi:MAG: rod shape-determining protein MreC, partial [Janthinobacterium lividum]
GRVNPDFSARLRGVTLDIVAPFWSTVRVPFDWLGGVGDTIGDYIGTVPRNRLLAAQLHDARLALQRQDALAAENVALKRLLHVIEPRNELIVVARFAGASSGSYARSAMISVGRSAGVVPGQPVRADGGLVGRTVEAGNHAARILLLTDTNSRVPVTVVRTGQPALAVGAAGRLIEVRDRLGAEVPLKAGDRLLTSGAGGIFAPQIPVAEVVDPRHEPPLARPYVDPATLSYVAVYRPYLPVPDRPDPAAAVPVPVPREASHK